MWIRDRSLAYDHKVNTAWCDQISWTEEPAQTYTYDSNGKLKSVTKSSQSTDTYTCLLYTSPGKTLGPPCSPPARRAGKTLGSPCSPPARWARKTPGPPCSPPARWAGKTPESPSFLVSLQAGWKRIPYFLPPVQNRETLRH